MRSSSERPPRRRVARALLWLWGLTLLASHLWIEWRPASEAAVPAGMRSFETAALDDEGRALGRALVRYSDSGPRDCPQALVLLHGSPGSSEDFRQLAPLWGAGRRVIAPALPGFGASRQGGLPSYSSRAHARYVLALLDELGVQRAHLLGFSMGGGVALELTQLAPQRCLSLTLLSALGVEELELFGQHELNHAVHLGQWALLAGLRAAVPHFGLFDRQALDLAYARNFLDSDQRRLRPALEACELPALILHGEHDFLVPLAAAQEHARILPQSELVVLDSNHFLPWTDAERVAETWRAFAQAVEAGAGRTRSQAEPERLAAAARPFDPADTPPFAGPALALILCLLALATLITEDLTCIGAGLLVAEGRLGWIAASLACFVGIYVGDMLLFLAGRALGRPALGRRPLRWLVSEAAVTRASSWFQRQGPSVIFLSRLTPGLRLPTYFAAGVLRTRLSSFALYFALAGLAWTPALVGLSAWLGASIVARLDFLHRHTLFVIALPLALLWLWRKLVLPCFTHRGRRLLKGALLRKLQWEYWPAWLFYPPVALHIAYLALRFKSLTLPTAVNPAIPTGGFVGESKGDILDALGGPEHPAIARYERLLAATSGEERVEAVRRFRARHELALPVVLKPDVGQRGSGVQVIRSEEELVRRLRALDYDAMLQEFVPGREYGLFWWREPGAETGRLFSLTEKCLPTVEGDGVHTLEELILRDARAICMAHIYFEVNAERLHEVPEAGERRTLVELGTHCRGAIFRDAEAARSTELEAFVEQLSAGFEGFDFGRYDVRVPSQEELRSGRAIRVLELNGLTSEATHIYDARHGVLYAWRTLRQQWRAAFVIAAWNRERGARVSSLRELYRELRRTSKLLARHSARATP